MSFTSRARKCRNPACAKMKRYRAETGQSWHMERPELPISLRSLLARRGCGCSTRYLAIRYMIHILVLVFATASFQPVLAEQRSAGTADRHFSEGVRLLSKRDWKGASGEFREVLKLDP